MHNKRDKLNQPLHIAGNTLSPSSCTHFSPSILKLSWQTASLPLGSLCWDIINSQKLYSWGCKPLEISDSASISLNLLLSYKTLGLNVLELQFVMLANHDQNVLVFVFDLLKVCLYVKLESSILQDLLCKST